MISEKVLSLDVSSKTGFSVQEVSLQGCVLLEYGLLGPYSKPDAPYPSDYLAWSLIISEKIIEKINQVNPDVIIIEETSKGSKNHLSQKILEWTHRLLAEYFVTNNLVYHYYQTGEWRQAVGAKMTKEEKKRNALSNKIKKTTGQVRAKDENGKIIGKVSKKHVNVRIANELYGLKLKVKDNDKADAILLCRCYYEYKHNNFKRNIKE